jgi:hypothetical protein
MALTLANFEGVLDAITGATPTGQPAPAGSDQVPLSKLTDRRKAWNADFSRQFSGINIALGVGNSRESDYVSTGWSLNTLTDFNQKNTTLLAGVAGLIEVAEALQHLPNRPRRPILFAFWDGEEKGLLGSYHFLRVAPQGMAGRRVVLSVNLDMIGRLRGNRLDVYGSRTAHGLREMVVQANNRPSHAAGLDLSFVWDIEEDSDHYPFIATRIPTVMFHTGLHDHYHRPSDDVHLVNLPGIEPVARLALGFVAAVANDPAAIPPFRGECRTESNTTRNRLEAAIPDTDGSPRGRWGIGTRNDSGEPDAPVIIRVWRDSPAHRAGVMPGDRIMAIDDARISSHADMLERLKAAGTTTVIDVERRGHVTRLELSDTAP